MSGRGAGPRKSVGPTVSGSGWDMGAASSSSWEKERDPTIPEPLDPWKEAAIAASEAEDIRKEAARKEAMARHQEEVRRIEEARRQEGASNGVMGMAPSIPSIQPAQPDLVPSANPIPEGARGSFNPSLPPFELRIPFVPVATSSIPNQPPVQIVMARKTAPPHNLTNQKPPNGLSSPFTPNTAPVVSNQVFVPTTMASNTARPPRPITQHPANGLSIPPAPVAAPTSSSPSQTPNPISTVVTIAPHLSHITTQNPVTGLSNLYAPGNTPVGPNQASFASTTTTATIPPHQRVQLPATVQYPNRSTQYAPTPVPSAGPSNTSNSHQPGFPHHQVPSQPEPRPNQHVSGHPSLIGPFITNTGHQAPLPHQRVPSQTPVHSSQHAPGPISVPGPPMTNSVRQTSQAQLMQEQALAQFSQSGPNLPHATPTPSPFLQPSAHNNVTDHQYPHHFKRNPAAPTFLSNSHVNPNPPSPSPHPSLQVPAIGGPTTTTTPNTQPSPFPHQPVNSTEHLPPSTIVLIERYGKALKDQEMALQREISDDEQILAIVGDARGLPEIEYLRMLVQRRVEGKRMQVGAIRVALKGDGGGV